MLCLAQAAEKHREFAQLCQALRLFGVLSQMGDHMLRRRVELSVVRQLVRLDKRGIGCHSAKSYRSAGFLACHHSYPSKLRSPGT